jgi:hypothetical protein
MFTQAASQPGPYTRFADPYRRRAQPLAMGAAAGLAAHMGRLPTSQIGPFKGARDTLKLMSEQALGDRGERSMLVRHFTTWVVRDVWPKDYLGEILALRNVLVQQSPFRPGVPLFRYTNDARHVEVVKDPQRQIEEIMDHGTTQVDCDEIACTASVMALQLGREVEYVAMGFAPDQLTHVGCRVKEPKSGRWIWLDGVAGPREKEAASRAQELLVWSLD